MTKQQIAEDVQLLGQKIGLDLSLDTWSPGDGWTRYRIYRHYPGTTGITNWTQNMRRSEMESFVTGALKTYYAMEDAMSGQ